MSLVNPGNSPNSNPAALNNLTITAGVSVNVQPKSVHPYGWNLNGIYFDAWLHLRHYSALTITQHPVETGAAISDHCYMEPLRFQFEIGMTDVNPAPITLPGSFSRSINMYNILKQLQATRTFCTLTTKYGDYNNILIESLEASDDFSTQNASKMSVNLVQPIVANTSIVLVSAQPQTTDQTNRGTAQVQPLPDSAAGFTELAKKEALEFIKP